ncbi:MAG TPA: hypothetical protein VHS96_15255 [Bacteroidia bacterium]|nr:hypothetical protein [Bacteroidia bacterium]
MPQMKMCWLLFLLCCAFLGCKETNVVTNPINLENMEGKTITIQGKALNSKAGAVAGDYFVDGLQAWPADIHSKTVEVTGTLKTVEHAAEDLRNPDGSINQGMEGKQYILMHPKWRLVGE